MVNITGGTGAVLFSKLVESKLSDTPSKAISYV